MTLDTLNEVDPIWLESAWFPTLVYNRVETLFQNSVEFNDFVPLRRGDGERQPDRADPRDSPRLRRGPPRPGPLRRRGGGRSVAVCTSPECNQPIALAEKGAWFGGDSTLGPEM